MTGIDLVIVFFILAGISTFSVAVYFLLLRLASWLIARDERRRVEYERELEGCGFSQTRLILSEDAKFVSGKWYVRDRDGRWVDPRELNEGD